VVENGNLTTQPNTLFGVVVIRGGEAADGTSADTGTCSEGFVNAEGNIKIAGSVTDELLESAKRPAVRQALERELYQ